MGYLMDGILILLAVCVLGVFILLSTVFGYIVQDIIKSRPRPKSVCDWTKSTELDDYTTGCRNEFYDASESSNPVTDTLTYCPYCGDHINVKERDE